MTENFKKLSGLRAVFILAYAVPGACHPIPNYGATIAILEGLDAVLGFDFEGGRC